jgi:hypothetical protein
MSSVVKEVQQKLFNKAAIHLLQQNARSRHLASSNGYSYVCAYRGADGAQCAIGALIPDSEYSAAMEGTGCFHLLSQFPKAIPELVGLDKVDRAQVARLLSRLQTVHDVDKPESWLLTLGVVAREYSLSFDDVEKSREVNVVHIVYVHPVENGEPNRHKVLLKREFTSKEDADRWVNLYNSIDAHLPTEDKAVYHGCVNAKTGDLV